MFNNFLSVKIVADVGQVNIPSLCITLSPAIVLVIFSSTKYCFCSRAHFCSSQQMTRTIDVVHLLVVGALAAVSTWGANNLFPIKLNYLTGIWSRDWRQQLVYCPTIFCYWKHGTVPGFWASSLFGTNDNYLIIIMMNI